MFFFRYFFVRYFRYLQIIRLKSRSKVWCVFNVADGDENGSSHLLENCFSDVTLILFFMRPTWTMLPRFPVFPFTLILSFRKVSYWIEHSDVLGKRTLVNVELGKGALVQKHGQLLATSPKQPSNSSLTNT